MGNAREEKRILGDGSERETRTWTLARATSRRAGDSRSRRPVYPPNRYWRTAWRRTRSRAKGRDFGGPSSTVSLPRTTVLTLRPFTELVVGTILYLSHRTRTLLYTPRCRDHPGLPCRPPGRDGAARGGLRGRAMLSTSFASRLALIPVPVALGETSRGSCGGSPVDWKRIGRSDRRAARTLRNAEISQGSWARERRGDHRVSPRTSLSIPRYLPCPVRAGG